MLKDIYLRITFIYLLLDNSDITLVVNEISTSF